MPFILMGQNNFNTNFDRKSGFVTQLQNYILK
jgi:hypothetical protein